MIQQNRAEKSLRESGFLKFRISKETFSLAKRAVIRHIFLNIKHYLNQARVDYVDNLITIDQCLEAINSLDSESFKKIFGLVSNRMLPSCDGNLLSNAIIGDLKSYLPWDFAVHCARNFDINACLQKDLDFASTAIYYRVVPPNIAGYAHRDYDFWSIDIVPDINFAWKFRYKVWVPLIHCYESNSLKVWPSSHLQDINIKFVDGPNGFRKPYIEKHILNTLPEPVVPVFNNLDCILFDDKLVHQGPLNTSANHRISLEVTLFSC